MSDNHYVFVFIVIMQYPIVFEIASVFGGASAELDFGCYLAHGLLVIAI
ncbi:hypothetical protein RCH33_963 [Flavobacterium daejeonense]|nr:hypothetical protein RCH33_963 [Flavobacterium daejeonense]